MNKAIVCRLTTCSMLTLLALSFSASHLSAAEAPGRGKGLDTSRIERLIGVKGKLDEKEGVFKVSVPRADLHVSAAGVTITPPMGLTSWAAFMKAGNEIRVMGDLVLVENQVNPVMSVALDNGLEVTALHNHFLWDYPKVMFMHIGGKGDEEALATAVGKVFAKVEETSTGKGEVPPAPIGATNTPLDPKTIEAIIDAKGEMAAGVFKIVLGRTTHIEGDAIGGAMGVNTWAAFAGSDEQAVVDGDFVLYEDELQPVLKALRRAGIYIAAIHHHVVQESPRVIFVHYWGVGPTGELARALQSALEIQRRHP